MAQEIIAYLILAAAVVFLVRKFWIKPKKKNCDSDDCGCH
ncbi:MAG: FeoB-associated Cys-rich membrane protein [Bacteroidetes bacterium]|nr:FeoB-associated Cys-rich membrane protein [Bacteroidota bacterium]